MYNQIVVEETILFNICLITTFYLFKSFLFENHEIKISTQIKKALFVILNCVINTPNLQFTLKSNIVFSFQNTLHMFKDTLAFIITIGNVNKHLLISLVAADKLHEISVVYL